MVVAEALARVVLVLASDAVDETFCASSAVATSAWVPERGTVAEPHSMAHAVKYGP